MPKKSAQVKKTSASSTIDRRILNRLEVLQRPGKPDIIEQLIRLFLDRGPKRMRNIEQFLRSRDKDGVAGEAHLLKSSCVHLGASRLGDLCSEIEALSEKSTWPALKPLVSHLRDELRKVSLELKNELTLRKDHRVEQ